jgi:hypothetical protein
MNKEGNYLLERHICQYVAECAVLKIFGLPLPVTDGARVGLRVES